MMTIIQQLYRRISDEMEYCFNIESGRPLTEDEERRLRLLLADGFVGDTVSSVPHFSGKSVVEVGPRLNFATAWSANMVSICRAAGLAQISRVERSRRYQIPPGVEAADFISRHHDRMTECRYDSPLTTFETGIKPEPVYDIPLKEKGPDALLEIPGISMDEWDRNFYYDYFVKKHRRNPTIVEIMDLNNANSEHSRHGFFRGRQIIDGEQQPENLMEIVKSTLSAQPANSVIAFNDNSSAIKGRQFNALLPARPGLPSPLAMTPVYYHIIFTAETHNFPTGVAPFPGAETGSGGRLRDVQGTGKGGFVGAGTAGYCVANLHIPGYELPWEADREEMPCPDNLASALEIEIEASNGASDYGNKFGEPLIQGFTRSFDLRLDSGERWGYLKPIMFTGGIGQIDDRHTVKAAAEKGMYILQIGGPAYRVGFGGGAASSMMQGDNAAELDFNAVQRGDAEMEQKMNRVIRACNEMGGKTLIDVIHDQGAGGPGNVLKELVEHSGGRIGIRKIITGDPTMSVLEIYVAEYQERNGILVQPANLAAFQEICHREKVNCEVLGQVTGDLRFVVYDEEDDSTPVDLELNEVLGNVPIKTFKDERRQETLPPLTLPAGLSVRQALYDVLRLVAVGSKRFLTNKVDRAVSGLVARQQCCGPVQAPVSDVAVIAQGYTSLHGAACAIGEQPNKMIADSGAGARMAVAESLTNLVWARIDGLETVKCSANWMWAPKLPGEGAALYDAALAMRDAMLALGMAVDGGKDSLSMATRVGEETVKSPRQLVISAYAAMADIRKVITPDLKAPGNSTLCFIDLSRGKTRLGGSSLAQTQGQIGADPADMDDPAVLRQGFNAVQELIDRDLILAGHDRSDGGLITTILEMTFAGNCGAALEIESQAPALEFFFNEELGLVVECRDTDMAAVREIAAQHELTLMTLGRTTEERVVISYNQEKIIDEEMPLLRQWWEETSFQLECLQMNRESALEERKNTYKRQGPRYNLPFTPRPTAVDIINQTAKPRVAILRDEGSNSDREMAAAFFAAGFEPWDITMTDLLSGRARLDNFRGLAAVGGFSYADVPESAKGWAATIQFNPELRRMFTDFYERPDTFSLGVCNGCQLFALLGWIPWLNIPAEKQPRFVRNTSGRFESRWTTVKILRSPALMLRGMADMTFGIHVDHGEGRLNFPEPAMLEEVINKGLTPVVYADDNGSATEDYPFNPNGSPRGIAALCTPDGRHLAMMPHPERAFLPWQAHWLPEEMKGLAVSPWLTMFQNAYQWCSEK
ncbi:MAG TPA: phosphoribosylformylglycinamidine synthase [Desulfobacterales bacterium]|nr:phosphoribosylformylglycinamidine synthase [Desulfobacterales bacterium]